MHTFSEIVDELDRDHYTFREGLETWRGVELDTLCFHFKTDADEILRAMRQVANRYRLRGVEKRCESCGMPIVWRDRIPYDREGLNHFISCPNRNAHRKQ